MGSTTDSTAHLEAANLPDAVRPADVADVAAAATAAAAAAAAGDDYSHDYGHDEKSMARDHAVKDDVVVVVGDDPEWGAAERRYMRRLNWIILPTISLLYFFEYLDRGNVAVSARARRDDPSAGCVSSCTTWYNLVQPCTT